MIVVVRVSKSNFGKVFKDQSVSMRYVSVFLQTNTPSPFVTKNMLPHTKCKVKALAELTRAHAKSNSTIQAFHYEEVAPVSLKNNFVKMSDSPHSSGAAQSSTRPAFHRNDSNDR